MGNTIFYVPPHYYTGSVGLIVSKQFPKATFSTTSTALTYDISMTFIAFM